MRFSGQAAAGKTTRFLCMLLVYLTSTASMLAQTRPEFGVRIAAPVRGPMLAKPTVTVASGYNTYGSTPRHLLVGVSASIPILHQMRLRLDPGYQRIGTTATSVVESGFGTAVFKSGTAANRWRVPVLLETEFGRHVRLGVGPEVSIVSGSRTIIEQRNPFFDVDDSFTTDSSGVKSPLLGIAAALEAPFRRGSFTLAPEIRYTRWTGKHFGEVLGHG